jgi:N-acetylglucosaminyldiphosphoundecaprenol N-acetyl-beta-D-mannosaminyltransferase
MSAQRTLEVIEALEKAPARRTVELFGVPTDVLTMEETILAARGLVRRGTPHQHVVLNAAKVVALDRDPRLRAVIEKCDLVNADGASVVWASRVLGRPLPERVTGVDLFLRLVEAAAADGTSVYFLGATQEVVESVVSVFSKRFPRLKVAGYRNGYWDDDNAVIDEVRAARPDYLFLAIPSPRKEFWVNEHLKALGVPFVMGVGGSFDVVAGKVSRAPVWLQRVGMEWTWRLLQEPRRMWKRYLVGNASFIRLTVRACVRAVNARSTQEPTPIP